MERHRRRAPDVRWEAHGHHIQYYAAGHEANVATRAIREKPGLIVPGPRPIHNQIHGELEYVPPLSMHMAQHALKYYEDEPHDNVRSLENLMRAIERAQRHPKADEIELAVASLAIRSLEIQRPYIIQMQDAREKRTLHIV